MFYPLPLFPIRHKRVIETLKYEWFKKIAIFGRYRHPTQLCCDFADRNKAVPLVPENAKKVPVDLETKRFKETKVTAYRIKKAV